MSEITVVEFESSTFGNSYVSELSEGPPYTVHGIALGAGDVTVGTSGIKKKWPADELKRAANSLKGRSLVVDHDNDASGVVGEVTKAGYKEGSGVVYEAELYKEELAEKVKGGLLEVSIRGYHADVGSLEEDDETGAKVVEDIEFDNLSIVPKGAAPSNTLEIGEHAELSAAELSSFTDTLDEAELAEIGAGDWVKSNGTKGITISQVQDGEIEVDIYKEMDGQWRSTEQTEMMSIDSLDEWDVDEENVGAVSKDEEEMASSEATYTRGDWVRWDTRNSTEIGKVVGSYTEGDDIPDIRGSRGLSPEGDEILYTLRMYKERDGTFHPIEGKPIGHYEDSVRSAEEPSNVSQSAVELGRSNAENYTDFNKGDWVQWYTDSGERHGKVTSVDSDNDEVTAQVWTQNSDGEWKEGDGTVTKKFDDKIEGWGNFPRDMGDFADGEDPRKKPADNEYSQKEENASNEELVSNSVEKGLKNKVEEHNEKHAEDDESKRVTYRMLKNVYNRGMGAYNDTHREGMTQQQWSYARVNAFLYLVRNGNPENDAYKQDNDLLPEGHPKYDENPPDGDEEENSAVLAKSYDDYPEAAAENAQMALDAKEETDNPNDCGTDVGWKRARQLANGEGITRKQLGKMSSFNRHRQNSNQGEEGRADCGWMMWKAWGGDEGVDWAQRKLDSIGEENSSLIKAGMKFYSSVNNSMITVVSVDGDQVKLSGDDDNDSDENSWIEPIKEVYEKLGSGEWDHAGHSSGMDENGSTDNSMVEEQKVNAPDWDEGQMVEWQVNPNMKGKIVHVDRDKKIIMVEVMEEEGDGEMSSTGFTVTAGFSDLQPVDMESMSVSAKNVPTQDAEPQHDPIDNSEDILDLFKKFMGKVDGNHSSLKEFAVWSVESEELYDINRGEAEEETIDSNQDLKDSREKDPKWLDSEIEELALEDIKIHHKFNTKEQAESFVDDSDLFEDVHKMGSFWVPGESHKNYMNNVGDESEEEMATKDDHRHAIGVLEAFLDDSGSTDSIISDFIEWMNNDPVTERSIEEYTNMADDGSMESPVSDYMTWLDDVVVETEDEDKGNNPDEEESADEGDKSDVEEELQEYEMHTPDWSGTTEDDWSSPDMEDFDTDDLEEISSHFLISSSGFPPENFTDLKLPVVEPNGDLNVNALAAVKGGRGASAVDGLSSDMETKIVEWVNEKANDPDLFDREWGMEENMEGDVPEDHMFESEEDAMEMAKELGMDGVHQMGDMWVPGETHEEYMDNVSSQSKHGYMDDDEEEMIGGTSGRPTPGQNTVGGVRVLSGDDLQFKSDKSGESDVDSLTTYKVDTMTDIEDKLAELNEPVAVEAEEVEQLRDKADRLEEMSENLEALRERTDILDDVPREQVEELADLEDSVVVESDRYEELQDEAEQVAGVYAASLAEEYPAFDADELTEKFSIEELRSKFEDEIGEVEDELTSSKSANPQSQDPSEESLKEASSGESGEGEEELSAQVEQKQDEIRNKILGGD